ncbi:hypothetical protein PCYB_104040 [Plasmodium cynomolgi strain B]|uniref:Uncharacterized protein n=1 Tax=Plasmodium cynomolgi (strain B) TaxID=1120755 RepID=K6UUG8_PLACD|nr:hypothetical protein PCYB_104040 [Plasmodium cynomolgi strain B]GAB67054.1 hypothetical protein PCYB_104040 [Plasmodium cynomolgi strain B]
MKRFFTALSLLLILLAKRSRCSQGSFLDGEYPIFISNILINNVSFTFHRDRYHYELEASEHLTEITLSPLLNIWENYIYKKVSPEDELFFNEHTSEYLDNEQSVAMEELYLKTYHIYVNKKKVYLTDLPYRIHFSGGGQKELAIWYESQKTYKIKIKNNNEHSNFYLNDVNLSSHPSSTSLLLDKEFKSYIYFYSTNVAHNVEGLNIQASCRNSQMYINNNLLKKDAFFFPLNQNTYNNVLVIECRQQRLLEKEQLVGKKKNTISENFIKRKFQESVLHSRQKGEKKSGSLDQVMGNYHKLVGNPSSLKKDDKNISTYQSDWRKRLTTLMDESNYNPLEKKKNMIKKIFRKFYFFNIYYHVHIDVPNYIYNLSDGNVCPFDPREGVQPIGEYLCGNFHKNMSFYADVSNKLFSFIKVDSQKTTHRFIDKVLNAPIHHSENVYLFLETYYDKKVLKIKFKKGTSFFSFLMLLILALVAIFACVLALFWRKICHCAKGRNHAG